MGPSFRWVLDALAALEASDELREQIGGQDGAPLALDEGGTISRSLPWRAGPIDEP